MTRLRLIGTSLEPTLIQRLYSVYDTAVRACERGVVEWVERAVDDACALGRLRDRDQSTLDRLERDFDREYYRGIARAA